MDIVITADLFRLIAVLTVFKYTLDHLEITTPWVDDIAIIVISLILSLMLAFNPSTFEIFYNALVAVGVAMWGRNFLIKKEEVQSEEKKPDTTSKPSIPENQDTTVGPKQ